MMILFIGEKPIRSSPLLTWANALEESGSEFLFVDLSVISTVDWIKHVFNADLIVYQGYSFINKYEIRQLSIAVLLGCPVVRKWSGSDIYYALNDSELEANVKEIDKLVSLNLTSEHDGILLELKSIGLEGVLTPQVINDFPRDENVLIKGRSILAYLPEDRYDFYGFDYIKTLILNYPEVPFIIISDKNHSLSHYPNVRSLGWVKDMNEVWDDVGLLIRITEHDGFPRTIVEALFRGKYVIHNRKYTGCWYAESLDEVDFFMNKFLQKESINNDGVKYIRSIIETKPGKILSSHLGNLKVTVQIKICSLFYVFKYTVLGKFSF